MNSPLLLASLLLQVVSTTSQGTGQYAWGDFDRDGLQDVVTFGPQRETRLFKDAGDGGFVDVTTESGLDRTGPCVQAVWGDLDCDGGLDATLLTNAGRVRVFRNMDGSSFEDVTDRFAELDGFVVTSLDRIDHDGDGCQELLVRGATGTLLLFDAASGRFEPIADQADSSGVGTVLGGPHGTDMTLDFVTATLGSVDAPEVVGDGPDQQPGPNGASRPGNGPIGRTSSPSGAAAVGCADSLMDLASPGNCLTASSVPQLGALYPLSDNWFVDSLGQVGIGTTTPDATLDVMGKVRADVFSPGDDFRIIPRDHNFGPNTLEIYGYPDESRLVLYGNGGTATMDFIVYDGDVGIGTTTPQAPLDVAGKIRAETFAPGDDFRIKARDDNFGPHTLEIYGYPDQSKLVLYGNGGSATMDFIVYDGKVGIGTTTPSSRLDVNGEISTDTLRIRGGADLVEGFDTGTETCPPGTVVVIDASRPGHLAASTLEYDRRVAGVVSGAGDVRPGLRLGQEGVLNGETPVAMAGRVYVKCSAENGSIQPGDRLTTASLAGHAMRATDTDRSVGSVIGKAMTSLDEGTGLVLVLVNLQ